MTASAGEVNGSDTASSGHSAASAAPGEPRPAGTQSAASASTREPSEPGTGGSAADDTDPGPIRRHRASAEAAPSTSASVAGPATRPRPSSAGSAADAGRVDERAARALAAVGRAARTGAVPPVAVPAPGLAAVGEQRLQLGARHHGGAAGRPPRPPDQVGAQQGRHHLAGRAQARQRLLGGQPEQHPRQRPEQELGGDERAGRAGRRR